jgi:hypothetical protein
MNVLQLNHDPSASLTTSRSFNRQIPSATAAFIYIPPANCEFSAVVHHQEVKRPSPQLIRHSIDFDSHLNHRILEIMSNPPCFT